MTDFLNRLLKEKEVLKTYLLAKFESGDWHGCCDACNDLREIDAKLEIITKYWAEK